MVNPTIAAAASYFKKSRTHDSLLRTKNIYRKIRCYRKFDRSEILSQRSYFLGNFIAKRDFFLGNIVARKFDHSQSHRNERLLLSMTNQSPTPRNQSPE